jgi:alkanesulfonate monooxygenase SsuD/methylene tetrahydromethanopterin reductase-like flavin-dependent oxidoreductase (luciferase family)
VACSRQDTISLAARSGLGALTFAWIDPEDAKAWVDEYYRVLTEECVPVGRVVNANIASTTILACSDRQDVIARAVEGGNFFGYGLVHYYISGQHRPGVTDLWEDFQKMQAEVGYSTEAATEVAGALSAKVADAKGATGIRGSVGTPDQIRDYLRRYEQVGVDEMVFIVQGGLTRHEDIMESLELFGREVLPEFIERDEPASIAKAKRLEPAIDAAMKRRPSARETDPDYEFGAIPVSWEDGKPADDFREFFEKIMKSHFETNS